MLINEIATGKIVMQKTIQKSDEKQIRYARNNNSNYSKIYPTRTISGLITRDESNYKNLQNLFQTSDQINNQSLVDIVLSDFRKQIVNEILRFNPEE